MAPCVLPPPLSRERVAPPSAYALTLADAKRQVRIVVDDHDASVTAYLAAATEAAEKYLCRAVITQTWMVAVDGFWGEDDLELPWPTLQSVDEVTYVDPDGVAQTLDPAVYQVDTGHRPGRIRLAPQQAWPECRGAAGDVVITFTCGYGDGPEAVPATVQQAVRLLLAHNERNREAVVRGETAIEVPLGALWYLDHERIPEAA